ncbi:YciI family protein [Pseudonocardia sp. GCM10023141]|uniref:YciI family protein n=1 Tax=Pseudonocardia sp. GCM10023141 TaxID=3252653 RepID=UPI003605FDE8
MKYYLLSIYQPDTEPPAPEVLDPIMRDLDALNGEMRDAGVWVFAGGLFPPSTATVLQPRAGEVITTDGPFTEGKEHLGGFTVIKVEDLDEALRWGRKLTAVLGGLTVEVRPFAGVVD